jgi:pSer/pThr/pTyr-binding forkhead associated (FHA) protein
LPDFDPSALGDDGDDKTRFLGGVDIAKLRFPKIAYTLQILDTAGRWHDWGAIHASGINVGRSKSSADFPGLNSMAARHMRLSYNKAGLLVEDLGSINGVYRRISQPVELIDGMRFRIGLMTLEFHQAEPPEPVAPALGEDGEEFCSNDLAPLAYLDLIRPNNRPGLRIALTRTDATIIGREGPQAHIMLAGDHSVSAVHARVHHEQGQFFLEDLKSRNGTFLHILGSSPLQPGDEILAGRVKFRVVNQAAG